MRRALVALACALAAVGCSSPSGASTQSPDGAYERANDARDYPSKGADNTRTNVRDTDSSQPTPLDQGTSDLDVQRTADIRRRVLDAKLSVDAQNIKIITRQGRVTLRGPVKSLEEKDVIDRAAREVAGAQNVDDQIEVEVGR